MGDNPPKSRHYREKRLRYEKTRPVPVAIGEWRQRDPQGRPGYVRVDTMHQGDLDGVKGAYHINAVDEVTQWQVVGAITTAAFQRQRPGGSQERGG